MPNKRTAAQVAQIHKDRDAAQSARAHVNFLVRKMSQKEIEAIRARTDAYASIGRDYGLDEFTVARIARYGKFSPWQHAKALRNEKRKPLQEAWAKKNKQDKLAAS